MQCRSHSWLPAALPTLEALLPPSRALGASGVQLGTAYLFCPEAHVSPLYRQALSQATENGTTLTNLFSGRPARGISNRFFQESGPMSDAAPAFRMQQRSLRRCGPLQAAPLGTSLPAAEFTRKLAADALRYRDERFSH